MQAINLLQNLFVLIFDTIINFKYALIFCAGGLGNPNLIHNLVKDSPKNIGRNL